MKNIKPQKKCECDCLSAANGLKYKSEVKGASPKGVRTQQATISNHIVLSIAEGVHHSQKRKTQEKNY